MTAEQRDLPKLNLVRRQATHLSLACNIPWNAAVESAFGDALDEDGDALAVRKYSASKTPHILSEYLRKSDDLARLVVSISYDAGSSVPATAVPKELQGELELIDRFKRLEDSYETHCHVDFRFGSSDETGGGAWFPLPTPTSAPGREAPSPVDEIRGIRGVKLVEGSDELEYDFVLDRPLNRDISLSVTFDLIVAVDRGTPQAVLDRASGVAARLGLSSRREGAR